MKTLVKVILVMILITSLSSDEVTILNVNIPDFQVNDDQGTAWQINASISIDSNGNFIITWCDQRNGNYDIYAQRYTSDGTTLSSNFKVNEDSGITDGNYCYVSIATDDSGNFIITWCDVRNGNYDIYAQQYTSDGTALGSNFKVNDDQNNTNQYYPSIAVDSSGNFIIAWVDERNDDSDIYAQRYSSDGTTFGINFKVNDDEGSIGQFYPSISTDSHGNFIITWTDGRNLDNNDIYAQRYSSDGIKLGSNFKVNDDEESVDQACPSISIDGRGNFIISWWDGRSGGSDIYAQRYSSDGTALGSNFKVNDDQNNTNQYYPSIAADSSGNFIITWMDERNDNYDIYAQRYTNEGTVFEFNFRVTNTGEKRQGYPDVKLCHNRIYTTWEDRRAGKTDMDIWANVLNWNFVVGIGNNDLSQIPTEFVLHQNFPNPFNPSTKIKFSLPKPETVTIEVYNIIGQKIETLLNKPMPAGYHEVEFNGQNLSSGVYLYRITAGEWQDVKKMVLLQ